MSASFWFSGGHAPAAVAPADRTLPPDAWATGTLALLFPDGARPTRQVIDTAMAVAIPPIGTPAVVHWDGRRRREPPWRGAVDGQYSTGFTILLVPGHYRVFVSYVDLWCRHAEIQEPTDAAGRIRAVRQVLIARLAPSVRSGA